MHKCPDVEVFIPIVSQDPSQKVQNVKLMHISGNFSEDNKNYYINNHDNGLTKCGLGLSCDAAEKNVKNFLRTWKVKELQNKLCKLVLDTDFIDRVPDGESYQLGLNLANFVHLIPVKYNRFSATGSIGERILDGEYYQIPINPVTDLKDKLTKLKDEYIKKYKIQAIFIPFEEKYAEGINDIIHDIKNIKIEGEARVKLFKVSTLEDAFAKLGITRETVENEEASIVKQQPEINNKTLLKKFLSIFCNKKKSLSIIAIAIVLLFFINIIPTLFKQDINQDINNDQIKQLEDNKKLALSIKNLTAVCRKMYPNNPKDEPDYRHAIDDLDGTLFSFLDLDFKKVPETHSYISLADYFLKQSYYHANDVDMKKATEEAFHNQLNKLNLREEMIKNSIKKNTDCDKLNNLFENLNNM